MKDSIFEVKYGKENLVLVMFGGYWFKFGMPKYEFIKLTEDWNINRVYIKDNKKAWYSKGLTKLNENYIQTATRIKKKLDKLFPNCKKIFLGNSMGGFASIYFGHLCKADKSIAFSPMTFTDDFNLNRYRDMRWKQRIDNSIKKNRRIDLAILSLKHKVDIYYDNRLILDRIHAEHLKRKNKKYVNLHPFEFGSHELVRILKEKKLLKQCIFNSLKEYL